MNKQNCWEFKKCGRGPDGKNDCPAAQDAALDGIHGGVYAGRACWVSAGTNADAVVGTFAIHLRDCLRCDFNRLVRSEEEDSESGFSATRLGMIKHIRTAPESAGRENIDALLRHEFVQEVSKIMSGKKDAGQNDLREEFAREVERVSARAGASKR